VSKYEKEVPKKSGYRRVNEDSYDKITAERNAELEATRRRTAELRALRLTQEARGRGPKKLTKGRVARSATRQTLSEWLSKEEREGRKT
jgi:hypothetical protein